MKMTDTNATGKDFVFNVNISFDTKTSLTPRIIEVSDAFGLGINEQRKFTIYNDFRIGFNKEDIIFITGDSGGGKSLLLKYIRDNLRKENHECLEINDIQLDVQEQVIDSIGLTAEEGIKFLSMMGLNDAFIFLRKIKQLSDGQKYRFRLAKLLEEKPEFMFIDEFCANLDRTTAKVIAYNLQKVCRKLGITLFCATTHTDLREDLNPSVCVEKRFMDEVTITYSKYQKKKISFFDDIVIEEGIFSDYKSLAKYHYKNMKLNFPYMKVVKARYGSDLVGVAVFSPPFLQTKGRNIKFDNKYSRMKKEVVSEINKYFVRGSRYVISPKYRGCGLGQLLVTESMEFIKDKKYLEVITVMGKYNPVFERAGMEKIEITKETDPPTIRLDIWMKEKGLRIEEINNPNYFNKWMEELIDTDKETLVKMTGKVLHHPKIGLSSKDGKRAEVVAQEKRYENATYKEVKDEIKTYLPKLYSGFTLYYIIVNPYYKEQTIGLSTFR